MITNAVILAAGLGSRLRERTKECPKGFLELDNLPIVERSIKNLLACGISKIYIGTGYQKEAYQKLAEKYPQIRCIFNPLYAVSGSLYTLYQMKYDLKDDFLLLESDLLYEKKALHSLLTIGHRDCVLASGFTANGDEVFIEWNENGQLVNMSKNMDDLTSVNAELVGISKLTHSTFWKMCALMETAQESHNLNLDYEDGLVDVARTHPVYVHKRTDLVWCEVDDEAHWQRAQSIVYPLIKARDQLVKPVKRNVLLNPGPATTTDTVKYAQVVPDLCPRERQFGLIMQSVSEELTNLVAANGDGYTTVLYGGSGTAAVEAMLSSVVDEDKAILIVNNGAYGKRMCQMADIYGLNFINYKCPVDEALDLNRLEAYLLLSPKKIVYLAIVHNETTTGLLNDIEAVGKICQRQQITMMVDAMSSFAAIPIDMKKMNIAFLAASSNKNLQGLPGVSFVVSDIAQLEKTKHVQPRSLYLNLYQQYQYFKKTKQMRFTPPVQTIFALQQAILEAKWEGIENRYKRYSRSWETLAKGIKRLGFQHLIPDEAHSKIITAIIEPDSPYYDFNEMHDYFYQNGFTIYPGKVEIANTFRIANIGEIDEEDIKNFLNLLEAYLEKL